MSSLVLTGSTSGSVSVQVPDVAGSNTATIGAATGTHYPFTAGTAVASTSGTSIDFTSIPSWVKRITVMFAGVSTNGTSPVQVQVGTVSGVVSSGYSAGVEQSGTPASVTAGFQTKRTAAAADVESGVMTIALLSSNTWSAAWNFFAASGQGNGAGSIALSGTLDRVRITTVNGTDTFDAGSINILYE